MSHELALPSRLVALMDDGTWPSSPESALGQNASPLVADSVRVLAPDEDGLYLYPPPFRTVADDLADQASVRSYWHEFGAVEQLQPELALVIADFGIDSDSPILLDYRADPEPQVLRLEWRFVEAEDGGARRPDNEWVVMADSFDQFVDRVGLGSNSDPSGR